MYRCFLACGLEIRLIDDHLNLNSVALPDTRLIKPDDIEAAATLLRQGKLVAFPTDTFFALGAVITDESIAALFRSKGRMPDNPVPVLVSSVEQVEQVATEFSDQALVLAKAFWPGALTIVFPARADVPESVTAGTKTVGVRVPEHGLARDLISAVGSPLTGTSANISGQSPTKSAGEVMQQLDGVLDGVIDANCGPHNQPSTVIKFEDGQVKVLRAGSISESELNQALGLS